MSKKPQKPTVPSFIQLAAWREKAGKNAPVPASIVRLMEREWDRDNQGHTRLSLAVEKALREYGS